MQNYCAQHRCVPFVVSIKLFEFEDFLGPTHGIFGECATWRTVSYTENQLGWNNPGNHGIPKALAAWEVPHPGSFESA